MSRAAEDVGSVREVRIALVCYGGVSLAIYMHGITRELHRLVTASSRLDEDENPFEPLVHRARLLGAAARGGRPHRGADPRRRRT